MLMSHGLMSSGVIGCPNFGLCADPTETQPPTTRAAGARPLRLHIGRLPLLVDAPARDGVIVVLAAQATFRHEGGASRLHHAGVVSGTALEHCGSAVPLPGSTETGDRFRQDRFLQ